ncbi:transposase [Enterococcus hirae]|nr:transposase [Enterococcus hirae]MCD5090868.1 transposase [Enterococcus hirae]
MNDFTTELLQTLATKGDLNELFRSHLELAVNTLLRTELTAFLDYEKYDRKEICDDFKALYQADLKEAALEARDAFAAKWRASYPKVAQSILENDHLLTFYDFPAAIRRSLYSTNLIESFNKQVKKYSRRKEQFQNEESMDRFLVSLFENYNQKFLDRSHRGFQQAEGELLGLFEKLANN